MQAVKLIIKETLKKKNEINGCQHICSGVVRKKPDTFK